VIYKLRVGECPICCPCTVVNGPFMLGYPVTFEPSGFVSVVVMPVVERVHVVFRRGHVTSLVRVGGIARVGGRRGREGVCG
jgi:hypothetical protein